MSRTTYLKLFKNQIFPMKLPKIVLIISSLTILNSCTGYPQMVNYPVDQIGRSLNSSAAELNPRVNGRYIIFASDRNNTQDIYLFDMITRQLVELPGLNALDTIESNPSISADSRLIVFAASRQGKTGIYLYDRDTQQLRNLTTNIQSEVRNPTISADGSKIVFESSANGQWDILLLDRSGQLLNIPTDPQ